MTTFADGVPLRREPGERRCVDCGLPLLFAEAERCALHERVAAATGPRICLDCGLPLRPGQGARCEAHEDRHIDMLDDVRHDDDELDVA